MEKKTMVSDAELEILEVLWEAGKALNAAEIRTLLEKNKKWERTTILTLIQRLVKKGMLAQEKREVYYYRPNVDRKDYVKEETRNFVNKFFKGNAGNMAAALMSDDSLTKRDIEELRDFFNSRF
ncbi:BlaI/MecI/CopY family transcriptional regulator [Lachnoclostridium sp. An131]|uniref:BlaI/MecI/CopY family transcriptional regulator n=1 Tax=Lachnoclostridium sp. An131 TaxID=1965555 RepID=UPI00117B31E2|nr:BlaI/MecI/CopY family transcriptional regulator [Lachnoclostridium sp. An131]